MSSLTPKQPRDPEDVPLEDSYIVGDDVAGYRVIHMGRLQRPTFDHHRDAETFLSTLGGLETTDLTKHRQE